MTQEHQLYNNYTTNRDHFSYENSHSINKMKYISNKMQWICLFTQLHREKLAEASLGEAGFEVFAPLCVKLVLRRHKYVKTKQPLFPRYIFARGGADIAGAKRLNGVSRFAGTSLEMSVVDNVIINAIRDRCDESSCVVIKSDEFQSGQVVKIMAGPLEGLEAVFSEPDDRRRSFILLDMMGKSHRVKILNTAIQLSI